MGSTLDIGHWDLGPTGDFECRMLLVDPIAFLGPSALYRGRAESDHHCEARWPTLLAPTHRSIDSARPLGARPIFGRLCVSGGEGPRLYSGCPVRERCTNTVFLCSLRSLRSE